jgi:WD40 repeat protein
MSASVCVGACQKLHYIQAVCCQLALAGSCTAVVRLTRPPHCCCCCCCCRFGPEGKEYASGSEDGTIRIWQTDWLESQAGVADGAAQVAVNAVAPPYVNGAKA